MKLLLEPCGCARWTYSEGAPQLDDCFMQIAFSSMLDLHLWVVDIHTLMHQPSAALCGQQLPQQRRLLLCI